VWWNEIFIDSTSIKTRLLVSVMANGLRACMSFIAGLIIARGLSPNDYGDLMFLLASFTAIRTLMDMGSSNAFYTFISRNKRSSLFFIFYFSWLFIQLIVMSLIITLLLPDEMIHVIWLGHSKNVILLAFVAVFVQHQLWQTVGQIGEASRKTLRVQTLNIFVALFHIVLIGFFLSASNLSIVIVLWIFIVEYLLATIFSFWYLRNKEVSEKFEDFSAVKLLKEYWVYCKPLAILSIVGFIYEFLDRWLLQRFGGSEQQAFYQIAYQIAAVSLFATTSILRVFWKEISEAIELNNKYKVAYLFRRVNRGLVILSAILSGAMIPWSEQIITLLVGQEYVSAWPIMMVMFLYPIHQTMGQIGATMLLASSKTWAYMFIGVVGMLISIPLTYFMLAPTIGVMFPGLALGAMGMAIKMVLLNIVFVNIQLWYISRYNKWDYDFLFQVVGVSSIILIGYISKLIVISIWDLSNNLNIVDIIPFIVSQMLYICGVLILIWVMPWIIGVNKDEVKLFLNKIRLMERWH